jgi:hypothetical protein
MTKFCVFCGESPQEKNKEHVLPKWLIEMTGDPKRIATFGYDFLSNPISLRQFSFDALAFPACAQCNRRFGDLETKIKPIITRLLAHQPASSSDFILVLDWLDKVRVGLWLGYLYLDKNPMGVEPTFHIDSRLGRSDRMVAIAKINNGGLGLSFTGPEFKVYQLTPTRLGLRINGLYFMNASGLTLCSQRLGFPYARPIRIREDRKLEVLPQPGSGRVMKPVERGLALPNTVALYQPIFRNFLDLDDADQLLGNEYVRKHTADLRLGYGKVFVETPQNVKLYPSIETLDWLPSEAWEIADLLRTPEIVQTQLHRDFQKDIRLVASPQQRKEMRKASAMTSMVDRAIVKKTRKYVRSSERSRT